MQRWMIDMNEQTEAAAAESFESAPSLKPDHAVPNRMLSIDVFRGMVMFLMLAEIMHLFELAEHFPGNRLLEWLRFHTTHVAWEGCSLHDLIQPGFTFLGWSFDAVFHRKSNTARWIDSQASGSCSLAFLGVDRARHRTSVASYRSYSLHLRRHTDADRSWLFSLCS